jgi:hypothetical protein
MTIRPFSLSADRVICGSPKRAATIRIQIISAVGLRSRAWTGYDERFWDNSHRRRTGKSKVPSKIADMLAVAGNNFHLDVG